MQFETKKNCKSFLRSRIHFSFFCAGKVVFFCVQQVVFFGFTCITNLRGPPPRYLKKNSALFRRLAVTARTARSRRRHALPNATNCHPFSAERRWGPMGSPGRRELGGKQTKTAALTARRNWKNAAEEWAGGMKRGHRRDGSEASGQRGEKRKAVR